MNILYGILTHNIPSDNDYYQKETSIKSINDKANKLLSVVIKNIPNNRMRMFACFVCSEVLSDSTFGTEIQKIDANNTYTRSTRPDTARGNDAVFCLYDLIQSCSAINAAIPFLDQDIQDRVDRSDWFNVLAAICLQLLRIV